MIKHYIKFLYPGSFVAENSTEEVKKRERPARLPKHCFGYCFFDKEVVTKDGETLQGREKNFSSWTYIGKKRTLAQVKKETPNEKILISNMEGNDWSEIVQTRFGQSFPLEKGDKVETR